MNGLIAWLARNPVATNLMMLFVAASGLLAMFTVNQEVFPEVAYNGVSVEVPYLGAAPEEVETGVVARIEEAIAGITGVRRVSSIALEGRAAVIAEMEFGADARRVIDEVQTAVDAIDTFPNETEKPIILDMIASLAVVELAIAGSPDLFVLKRIAERVRDDLAALPAISQVEIGAAPPYEIAIEVSESALRRHALTFDYIADTVRRSSLDVPGGSIRTDAGEVLVRTVGQAYSQEDYENLPLLARPDGTHLLLGDVATVVDAFAEESDRFARIDGQPAVMVTVFRTGDESVIDVVDAVRRYVEDARERLPEGISVTVWLDRAEELRDRLSLMFDNGFSGLALVFVTLALLLELRFALWVSVGIPVAFLGAVALMPALDVSANVVSLFGFILVLGIVVDDAIIVGENIFRHQRERGEGLAAAVSGAQEIAKPVIFAVLTTVAAFFPLAFVAGVTGDLFRAIPLVVIPCLLFSLVESLGILPAHLAHVRARRRRSEGPWRRFQRRFEDGLAWCSQRVYRPTVMVALRSRYVTLALAVSAVVLTLGVLAGGWVPVHFVPGLENNFMVASVTMPPGTPAGEMERVIERFEAGAARLRERLERETGVDHYRHVLAVIGDQPMLARAMSPLPAKPPASNLGEVTVELARSEVRSYTSAQLGLMWRDETGPIPEATEIDFEMSMLSPGADIALQMAGPDMDDLRSAAAAVAGRLAEYAGVHDVSDSGRQSMTEMQLRIKPAAETLGVTLQDLGRQVRQAFYGEEVQRIQRGRDDVRVMLRYPRDERMSLGHLEEMRIRTAGGGEVPFRHVAEMAAGSGAVSIDRVDGHRAVTVTASVDDAVTTAGAVLADLESRILPQVLAEHPGVGHSIEGAQAEFADATASLQRSYILALLVMYGLLAVPLRSYWQPVIIMSAIPFGLFGAIGGHVLLGVDVTIMSILGLVALSGVVVNDALVMVVGINAARAGGDLRQEIAEVGVRRFRPIVVTSLTTVAGLTPLMMAESADAAFLIPMAVSLAFGVLFATAITLIVVPVIYVILADVGRVLRGPFTWNEGEDNVY